MQCVVVPIYKEFTFLSDQERVSLSQLYRVLGEFSIFFICPENIAIESYIENAKAFNVKPQKAVFAKHYFESISGYNSLLLSGEFYQRFEEFQFMLIYQPDAYVFSNEFEFWCKKGYDYIGAPWFEGWTHPFSTNIIGVGNGGFSLRNPKKYVLLLKRVKQLKRLRLFCARFDTKKFSFFLFLVKRLRFYFKLNSTDHFYYLDEDAFVNEDVFWGRNIGTLFSDFSVAPVEEAIRFSFEANPSYLFTRNNDQLPFGCHAWEKHEPEFWQRFISN